MNFDLNIDNYTKSELVEMFGLPSSSYYDTHTVERNELKLRDSILNNQQITKETRTKTLNFLIQAKTILLGNNANANANAEPSKPTQDSSQITTNSIYNLNNNLIPTKFQGQNEQFVQDRPTKPHISTLLTDFHPGIINPLNKNSILKNLNIDTRFRENYYTTVSTNFNVALPVVFTDVLSMELTSIELPQSVWNISRKYENNYFTIIVNGESQVVVINDGTYSNGGISQAINQALNTLGGNYQYIQFTTNVSNNQAQDYGEFNGTGQVIVTADERYVESFILNFQADRTGFDDRNTPLPLKLGWILGFRNGIYENNINYVSEGVIDVLGAKYYYLVVDDYNNNVNNGFYGAFNSSMLNNNILGRISFNSSNTINGIASYSVMPTYNLNTVTSTRQYFGPVNIKNLTIQLLDCYGRIVDLNNMDFSFCLTLKTVYDV